MANQGLPCPQPVLQCKHCLEADSPEDFSVLVDNEAAQQNVARFLATRGYRTTFMENEPGN